MAAVDAARRVYGCRQALNARLRSAVLRQRRFHSLVRTLAGWRRVEAAPHSYWIKPKLTIIGWGNASVGAGGSISRPGLGPSRAFERFVRANYYDTVVFIRTDEFHTSQVCTSCWELRPRNAHVPSTKPGDPGSHKRLLCTKHEPHLVVDRDVSASVAIMAVLLGQPFQGHPGVPAWRCKWRERKVRKPAPQDPAPG